MEFAGGDSSSGLDGINQWDYLRGIGPKQPRSQVLVNINENLGSAALIKDGWKLIKSRIFIWASSNLSKYLF